MSDEQNEAEPSGASGGYGDREPDLRGPAVIVDGSVIGGFTFTGPFATIDEASEWHRTRRLAGAIGLQAAAIVLLKKPRQEVFDEYGFTHLAGPIDDKSPQNTQDQQRRRKDEP